MSRAPTMHALVDAYLAARRSMGFDLGIAGRQLLAFARFADHAGHQGPLTIAVAVRWAQSARRATRLTWAWRLQVLRPFMKFRAQFETGTEIVPSNLFGPVHRRLVPHIYTEAEIRALLDAAAQLRSVTVCICVRAHTPPCLGCSRAPGCGSQRRSRLPQPTWTCRLRRSRCA